MSRSNDLTEAIITYLNLNGCFAWRNNTTGIYDPVKKVFRKNPKQLNGVSDILGIVKGTGIMVVVEVKTGKDFLSDDQVKFLNNIYRAKGIRIVARNLNGFIKDFKLEMQKAKETSKPADPVPASSPVK